jgi:cytochrome b
MARLTPGMKGNTDSRTEKSDFWGEFHEGMTGFLLFRIIVHICGVIVSSWIHRENLIGAMITGNKRIELPLSRGF